MKLITQTLLLYSKNPHLRSSIDRYIKYSGVNCRKYYKFIWDDELNTKLNESNHFYSVIAAFEKIDSLKLFNIILLIDYCSFETFSGNEMAEEEKILFEFILLYPEVKIMFITPVDYFEFESLRNLSDNKIESCETYYPHIFSTQNIGESFELAVSGKSNFFDFSGLRRKIKQKTIHHDIKASKDNFDSLHKNRQDYSALTIDEEDKQAYFNAYALYRYGYSVLPIINYRELQYITDFKINKDGLRTFGDNDFAKVKRDRAVDQILLIIRDYDLQFEDYDVDKNDGVLSSLRGFRYIEGESKWEKVSGNIWDCFGKQDKNGNIPRANIYFVTRFQNKKSRINHKGKVLCSIKFPTEISKNKSSLKLCGLNKPLTGLVAIQRIIDNYRKSWSEFLTCTDYMESGRIEGDPGSHSISPKILHVGESLISKAEKYLEDKMYLVAAIHAQEALEILNGFHFLEMLKALYIRTISETYLEVDNIGIKDDPISVHKKFHEIKSLAYRICTGNQTAYENIISQISVDVRHIYTDKELLESADACLREYIQNTSGVDLFYPFESMWKWLTFESDILKNNK